MDLRAKLARLRSMEPPAALFEPPPWAASMPAAVPARDLEPRVEREPAASEPGASVPLPVPAPDKTGLRAKLARLRSMEPPAALFEPPLSAADAFARDLEPRVEREPTASVPAPAPDKTGLRAKLARLRSMEPPAALFEPPPWAAVPPADEALPADAEPPSAEPAKAARIAQLRALIADVAARDRKVRLANEARADHGPPPWLQEATAYGPLHVCARYLEPAHHHGHAPVHAALQALPGALSSLVCDPSYEDLDLSRALYLDTETTGLAGGTGTVAFLVGLARFEDASLCVEQLIVPQLGAETPVLARLAERIAAASCLVTYNGKSFDWPLLRTRFVLARLPVPALPPHVDLLHVCRRLWKKRLTSVRLVDIEREVLGFAREDDLPGAEIPTRYFEFLRGGSPERLCPVLEHNQNDLIALPALLGSVMEQYAGQRGLCHAADALHFGKLALRARDMARARQFGEEAFTHSTCPREARAALTLSAEIEHRLGHVPEAIAFLLRALEQAELVAAHAQETDALAAAQLHFMLAKLYEHEQHDLARALRHARNTEPVEGPNLHGRRLGRLYRRMLRSAADASP
jgi:uncharacterized protein